MQENPVALQNLQKPQETNGKELELIGVTNPSDAGID